MLVDLNSCAVRTFRCGTVSFVAFWAELFKTNNFVCQRIVKTLITKYGIYANIFC